MDSKLFPLVVLLLGTVTLAGCGEGGGDNQAAAPPTDLAAQPVKDEHRRLELTSAWLAGRWQTGDGNCGAGDTFFTLDPNGEYSFLQEKGRWSLAGDRLTIEVTQPSDDGGSKAGDRNTNQVVPIGPNEAEFRTAEAPPIRVFRCHGG